MGSYQTYSGIKILHDFVGSLLAHLEGYLLGQLMPWLVVGRPYVVSPSLAFHIFDIFSRTISWIELKLSGRHYGNM